MPRCSRLFRLSFFIALSLSAAVQSTSNSRPDLVLQGGHAFIVSSMAFSPDNRLLATAAADTTIGLWDVTTSRELRVLAGHAAPVQALAFSPDGRFLASASKDNTVRLWEIVSGRALLTLTAPAAQDQLPGFTSVAFATDGLTLYAGNMDSSIHIWQLPSGRELPTLTPPPAAPDAQALLGVSAIALSPDGKTLLACLSDGAVQLFDLGTSHLLHTLVAHKPFQPPALPKAVTEELQKEMQAKQQANPRPQASSNPDLDKSLQAIMGMIGSTLQAGPQAAAFLPDGHSVAAPVEGTSVKVWDIATGRLLRSVSLAVEANPMAKDLQKELGSAMPPPSTNLLAFSVDGARIAYQSGEGSLSIVDLATGRRVSTIELPSTPDAPPIPVAIALNHDGSRLAAADFTNTLTLFSTVPSKLLATLPSTRESVTALAFSRDGRFFAINHGESTSVWDLTAGTQSFTVSTAIAPPSGLTFTADSGSLIVPAADDQLKLWNPAARQEVRSLSIEAAGLTAPIALSADGRLIAFQHEGGTELQVVNIATGNLVHTLPGNDVGISALAFSRDGAYLASGGIDGSLKLWDVAAGTELHTLSGHHGIVSSVVFSPDNSVLVSSASADDNLKLWNCASGAERTNVTIPAGSAVPAFSPDSHILAVGGPHTSLVLWDLASGTSIRTLASNTGAASVLSFSPDGRFLAAGTADGAVALFDPSTGAQLLSLVSTARSLDWLAAAPDGLFDGSPAAYKQIIWRFNNNTFDVAPVELFFGDFFYPSLLADVVAGKNPHASTSLAQKDRRQPTVQLALDPPARTSPIADRTVHLRITVTEAPAGADHPTPSGARDLRLFRNGSLVHLWPGTLSMSSNGTVSIPATVDLVAGENHLTAYAFNNDNVKSPDADLALTGSDSLARKGTAWILAIGINQYANTHFNLNFAEADARDFAARLSASQSSLGSFASVQIIPLLNADATRKNILAALARLAGLPASPDDPASFAPLQKAQPEDALFLFFAGHGLASGPRFILVPTDLGYDGSRDAINDAALSAIAAHGISDLDLESALRTIDVSLAVLVIDACNSGQALNSPESRRGPMNSTGLAQLAYEKGMFMLTASQGYQEAQELAQLGHGLLTYALVDEGLGEGKASHGAHEIYLRDWLDYPLLEVPRLQFQWLHDQLAKRRDISIANPTDPAQLSLQRPRVFYRRDPETHPFVVAHVQPGK
jgi:WD40 repeat protein